MSRLVAPCLLLALALPARAQLVLDGSLGPAGPIPLVSGEYAISDDLGRYSGSGANLFFSFGGAVEPGHSGFDIGFGETAHFSASLGAPQRVVARVTSGVPSEINGRIRSSIDGADLFLLNPSGLLFSDGAELDVQGSFYTSTADVLRFQDQVDLPTGDPTPAPLLSTAPPAAFGFTRADPALISVARSRALSVPPGETLAFVGGDVFVTGQPGFGVPDVIAPLGAALEIASAAGPVDLPLRLGDFDVDSVDPAVLGRVEISTFARVRVSGEGETPAGRLVIRGGEFALASDAQILARNESQSPALGPLDIAVAGDLVLEGGATLLQSWTAGEGRAGELRLSGDRVLLRNGADLAIFNGGPAMHSGEGPAATLTGRVVAFDSGAGSLIRSRSSGTAGSLRLEATEAVRVDNGAVLASELLAGSSGDGGSITVAAPVVDLAGGGQIAAQNLGSGSGTDVVIQAGSLDVRGGAQISTQNLGVGNGGAVRVFADALGVRDSGSIASRTEGPGAGGLIHLEATALDVSDGGRISSDTQDGPGGPVGILADRVTVSNFGNRPEGSFIEARNGGSITLRADQVELLHGGQVFTSTDGATPAGPLLVRQADRVTASGRDIGDPADPAVGPRPSGFFSRSGAAATASGGQLSIETRVLEVEDGAELSSATFGSGDAGPMELRADERLSVRGGEQGFALVSASAAPGSSGNGATLEIHAGFLELRDGGQITTSTNGPGQAGRIEAHARFIEISGVDPATGVNSAGFFSRSAGAGDGGAVELVASERISMSDRALISASSSSTGLAGDIRIDAGRQLRMSGSLITTEADISAGGNVEIHADSLVYLLGSAIETLVRMGAGGGGDVTIDPVHTVLNQSHVEASAVGGPGGNILIVTDHYFQSGASFLDASSVEDVDGIIQVSSPDTDLASNLVPLPAAYLDAASQLERDCAARTARAGSFVVRTRAAELSPPDAILDGADDGACSGVQERP